VFQGYSSTDGGKGNREDMAAVRRALTGYLYLRGGDDKHYVIQTSGIGYVGDLFTGRLFFAEVGSRTGIRFTTPGDGVSLESFRSGACDLELVSGDMTLMLSKSGSLYSFGLWRGDEVVVPTTPLQPAEGGYLSVSAPNVITPPNPV
jgi:hypothetical protein